MSINYNNNLKISGSIEKVAEFQERFMTSALSTDTDYQFSFQQIKPTPIFDNDEETKQWRRENWGCPEECEEAVIAFSIDYVRIMFDTVEKPPLFILETLTASMPELEFYLEFDDDNDIYKGFALFRNGILQDQEFYVINQEEDDDDEEEEDEEDDDEQQLVGQTVIQVQSLFQPPNMTGFHTCPICIKDTAVLLENTDDLIALACDSRHIYCQACIDGYFAQSGNNKKCPLCSVFLVVV